MLKLYFLATLVGDRGAIYMERRQDGLKGAGEYQSASRSR